MASPAESAAFVLGLALAREPTLGRGRLVCVDGPAGSGKTTLGAALAAAYDGSLVVHLDDLYAGWDGLDTIGAQLDSLLQPLAAGRPGSYRRYDWHAGAFAETVTVHPTPLLVLEGVGSGVAGPRKSVHGAGVVTAPETLRAARGHERDGDGVLAHWKSWSRAEDRVHARDATAARADVRVDGTGRAEPTLRNEAPSGDERVVSGAPSGD